MNINLLTAITAVVSTLAAAITAYLSKKAQDDSRKNYKEDRQFHIKEQTLLRYESLERDAISIIHQYDKKEIERVKNDFKSKEYKEIAHCLELCEAFVVGLDEGIYNKDILSWVDQKYLYREYLDVYPFIMAQRNISHEPNYQHLVNYMDLLGEKFPYMKREIQ